MDGMNFDSQLLVRMAMMLVLSIGRLGAADAPPEGPSTNRPAEFFPLDLASFVTTVFSNAPAGNVWNSMPRGRTTLQGVPFKIDGKFEVTGMDALRNNAEFIPTKVSGIPAGRKAEKVVLLHSTGWTEQDGAPMAKLVLRYANGEERSLRIAYGLHVRNWYEDRYEKRKTLADPNSSVAWSGNDDDGERNTPLRLYKTTFENPLPAELIQSIDVVSLFSRATPIMVAITLQNGGLEQKEVTASGPRRLLRKALAEPDAFYRRRLKIRAVASNSATALTNTTLFATLADDQASYFFGAYKSDQEGVINFDYPPHQTVSLNLLVKAPTRAPLNLTPERSRDGFPAEISAKLEPGAMIGGMVVDDAGKPVADAGILISSVTRQKPKVFTQLDYDRVRTDISGHWQSSALPHAISNLVLFLDHPEYKAITYQQPGSTATTTNTSKAKLNFVAVEELLANNSKLVMPRGSLVQGIVLDGTNKPLANAEVHFFENLNSPKTKRVLRTKADGRFSFVATTDTGEAAVAVLANGFAPRYEVFFLEAGAKPMELTLNSGSQIKARIMDNEQKPVSDATVKVEQWHNTKLLKWQTQTDAEGRFAWDGAPEGPITFSVTKTNYFTMRNAMEASRGEVTLTMRKMSNASGTLVDAETKKPIDEFTLIKGHSYSPGEPIRWNRYSGSVVKGRNGRYSVRLDDYYNGQSKIMIEAPGYLPVISPAFTNAGWYINNFELKKGRGITGTIVLASGEPVVNCPVALVDAGNSASIDQTGEFRSNSGNGDFARTDAQGKFQFPPKAEVQTLMAGHEKGFVQIPSDQLPADGKIALRPWGHIKGVLKVGPKPEPGQMAILHSMYRRYSNDGRNALSLYLRAPVDAQGNFEFSKVPPGDRMVGVLHEIRTSNRSSSSTSHSVPLAVKESETAEVVVGGTGRTIVGRIAAPGTDPSEIDWRRDLQSMHVRLPDNPENEPAIMTGLNSDAERQKFWQDRNERMRLFWLSEKGRALELKQRSYVLDFETNGAFHVYNVPPGTYDVYFRLTDPNDENDNYREIGSLSKQFVIPDGPADQPFDTGTHELRIRRPLRIGQVAPAFEGKTIDGKAIKLQDYRGKFVLMNFTAQWSGPQQATDLQTLKSLSDAYVKDGRLAMITLSVDYQLKEAQTLATNNAVTWPICYLGNWSETQVPALFGVEGVPHSILIGPDGKIVAKGLTGVYMKTTVRNALEAKRTASARNLP